VLLSRWQVPHRRRDPALVLLASSADQVEGEVEENGDGLQGGKDEGVFIRKTPQSHSGVFIRKTPLNLSPLFEKHLSPLSKNTSVPQSLVDCQ
jgi:hypothetical protein